MTDGGPPREQPVELWRRDFPLTSEGEDAVTRREFARYLVLASGAFAAGTFGVAAWTSVRRLETGDARPVVELADVPVGRSYLFRYPSDDDPAILVRGSDGEVRAFSQKCTHLGCVVFLTDDGNEFECPCHEGFFDASTGQPTAGPPDRPLDRIRVEVRDGTVWALGVEH